jgi:hypothetical protein
MEPVASKSPIRVVLVDDHVDVGLPDLGGIEVAARGHFGSANRPSRPPSR